MLAITIDLRREVEALAMREPKPGLHRAADAEIVSEANDARTARTRDLGRAIGRAIVDDDGLDRRSDVLGLQRANLAKQPLESLLFVERRNDDEEPHRAPRAISRV